MAVAAAGLAIALTACNTDPYLTGTAEGTADAASAGTDGDLLVIGPVDGDTVQAPFEVAVSTSVELGPAEDGLHHLQIWFDEKREETLTEHFADTLTVEKAPEGETTMWIQLADAEQQPVGEAISLALTVEPADGAQDGDGAPDGADPGGEDSSGDSGGDSGGDGYGDGY